MRRTRTLVTMTTLAVALLLCAAALAGAAGDDGTAATTASAVSEPAPTVTPDLSLAASPATITAGEATTLTLRLGVPGATVRLSRQVAGAPSFRVVADLVTDARGFATYRALPRVNTAYRAEFAGDAEWLPASTDAAVSVRPRVSFSIASRAYRGQRVRFAAKVGPADPGALIYLQMRKDGGWVALRTLKLGAGSTAQGSWRADAVGTRPLRVVTAVDGQHAAGASRVRRVQVVKPNPFHVPVDAKRIIVVDISQYRLHFYSYGRELRSFPCVTGRPSLPTPIGHFRVYARGVNPGGPYGARIMSYHPPCAIHGTNEPWLLKRFPRNFSHGCTRLANANAIWLYDHSPIGTPVWNVR